MSAFEHAHLGVRLLGGFAVALDGHPLDEAAWRLRRAKTLIKLLALAPQRRLHRDQLTEALWPDSAPAANSLHQVLYTARRALSGDGDAAEPLVLRDDVVTLDADGLWIDLEAFEQAAADAHRAPTVDAYREALALHGGELLPEDRYEEWTVARRQSVRETHLGLLVALGELQAAQADTTAAIVTLQQAVVEDPLHEAAHRTLIRVFAADGRRQQALAQYQQLRQSLRQHLAAEPDPETSRLYRKILAGQHEAEAVDAPALAPAPGGRLPHQLTSFIGRQRELGELGPLAGRARLLTLTGPGGCGKTRLALELARRLDEEFADGVRLVELAPIADPALVIDETATALGVQVRSQRNPIEVLGEQVGDRSLLLVLDNCEHLLDATVAVADGLLRTCPNMRVLATSRERLRVPGEVAWRVPPLSLPGADRDADIEALRGFEAVSLFCQRAVEAAPDFELDAGNSVAVAEICRRLDGMPLALELAAARSAALSPAQIVERLGDSLTLLRGGSRAALTRQQTLRATLAWSHDLLSEPEQLLYRRLGVFAGAFGVEAVEGVCAGLLQDGAFELLLALIEKSLVHVEPGHGGRSRYRLLETIRQDARERLDAAGEHVAVEAAHRAWYLSVARTADHDSNLGAEAEWPAERLDGEHDDLRTALASALRHDVPVALELANALWWYWMTRSLFAEGARWLEAALAAAGEPTVQRARGLVRLGAIDVRRSWVMRSVGLGAEALEIARASGDRRAEARALERLGVMAMGAFDWSMADRAWADGLALARELGDDAVAVAITSGLGVLAACRGQTDDARALLTDALGQLDMLADDRVALFWAMHVSPSVLPIGPGGELRYMFEETFCLFRAVGRDAGRAYVLLNLGHTWRTDGDVEAAREPLELALARFEEIGDKIGAGVALNALGNLARQAGQPDVARDHLDRAMVIRRAVADPREIATTLAAQAALTFVEGDGETGRDLMDEAHAIYERSEDAPGLTMTPLALGALELDHGDPARARDLMARGVSLSRGRGVDQIHGWALIALAEAELASGDCAAAQRAIDDALPPLERCGDLRAVRYAQALMSRA